MELGRTSLIARSQFVTCRILTISERTSIRPISKINMSIGSMNLSPLLTGSDIMLSRIRELILLDYSIQGCTGLLLKIYYRGSFILLCLIKSQLTQGQTIRIRCSTHISIDRLRSLFLLWSPITASLVLKLKLTPIAQ